MNNNQEEKPPGSKNGFGLPKKVGIIYSEVKREYFPTKEQYLTEKDALKDAEITSRYLNKLGISTQIYPGNANLPQMLKKHKPDVVINLVDSVKGNEYLSATIPALLELLEIPYTGAGILGMSLDHNKFLVKKLLQQNGIPVPHYQLFNTANDVLDSSLRFPLISKLNEIHGSVEISQNAISEDEKHLRNRLNYLIKTYEGPVLVEEFIVGKEFTAILLQGLNKKVYLAEKIFTDRKEKYTIASFDDLWKTKNYDAFTYGKCRDVLLSEYVKRAFEIAKMADYAKFDIRMDSSGRYFFLDSNCNPAFGPIETACALSKILELYGVSFYEILKRLLLNTVRDSLGKTLLPIE